MDTYLALLVSLEVYFSLFVVFLFTVLKKIIITVTVLNFSRLKGFLPFTLPVHSPLPREVGKWLGGA